MTGCDIVSFDLDGTLVDSAGEIVAAANAALADRDIAARPADEIVRLIGHGGRALMIALLARAFLERPQLADRVRVDDVIAGYEMHYERRIGSASRAYPGARQVLAELRRIGVRTACVSNKERHLAELSKHLCPSMLAEELLKFERDAEVYVTHLKPGETELTMQEIEESSRRVQPRMLQNTQVFEF